MKFLDFLNNNNGAFLVLFSFIVAIATAVYAYLTSKLVSETRKMRMAQTEPDVCTYIQTRSGWINISALIIQNIGLGSAHNIKFNISPDFKIDEEQYFSNLNFIKYGIDYLAPSQKVYPFTFYPSDAKKIIEPLNIKIEYENSLGKVKTSSFTISLKEIVGISDLESTWIGKLSHELQQISSNLNSLSSTIKHLKK